MEHAPVEARHRADNYLADCPESTLDILWAITRWYNGVRLDRDGQSYHIGWSRPPDLQTLLDCSDTQWQQRYQPAIETLQNPDRTHASFDDSLSDDHAEKAHQSPRLDEQYILRRKVKWNPTRSARTAMDTLFEGLIDDQELPQHQCDAESGLIGDWDETLLHRTGVAIVASIWRQQGRQLLLYPGETGQARPDVLSTAHDGTSWGAEVLTHHHDRQMPVSKFTNFAEIPHRNHLWIFETRQDAFETLNLLHESDDTGCQIVNAPFGTPENYSIKVGNKYIQKSRNDSDYRCPGIDRIDTITGWYDRFYSDDARHQLATHTSKGSI